MDKPHPGLLDASHFITGRGAGYVRSKRAYGEDDHVMVDAKPSTSFPVSHVLEFHSEACTERQDLSAQISAQYGVSKSTALSAVEAFGGDDGRINRWLRMFKRIQQVGVYKTNVFTKREYQGCSCRGLMVMVTWFSCGVVPCG